MCEFHQRDITDMAQNVNINPHNWRIVEEASPEAWLSQSSRKRRSALILLDSS
jgi:hypothetical protein